MHEKIHILVGEDDPNDRMLLQRAFKRVWPEAKVDLFPNGIEVLDHLRIEMAPPSLIILDTLTSQMTGWAVMDWLHDHPTLGAVPVVMLTGQANENDRECASMLGAKGYFQKPLESEGLETLLKSFGAFWQKS